jgi:myo-inositol 2-dehydrogenase / D-chiro-inositol 1-dehydrogenase
MGSKIRYGIVGCGMIAQEHIANLRLISGAEVVAIAEPVAECIAMTRASLGAAGDALRVYGTSAELAEAGGLDAVIVASPNHTHRAVLEPLFDSGLNILCEKPLATTIPDARWIVERAAASSGIFWTAMEYRYMPPAAEFIRQIHDQRIGTLRMLSMREHRFPFLRKVGDWNRFAENSGGTMVEKCCHFFDLMRLIVQSEAVRVYCSGAIDLNHLDERYEVSEGVWRTPDIIDNSYTTVDFANGVRAMLDLSMFAEGAENQEELTAVGDEARLDCLIPAGDLVFSPRTGVKQPKAVERTHIAVDPDVLAAGHHHGSTYYEHVKFAAAVRGEGQVEVTAHDGLMAVAIGAAAEISAREKRVVEMSELGFG